MKKSSALLIAAAFILSSCGTVAQYASSDNDQQFQDGIYSNTPAFRTKVEKEESKSDTQALIEKTQESPIYLFGDKKDTVMIPKDMSAVIRYDQKLGGTVVTVGENPYDWRFDLENNYGYYYGPYSIGSSWYWSRHYNPWYSWSFAPWRYHGWYDPWYYGANWGWYDPWYYGGYWGSWYDPWYYGGFWGGGWYYTGYYPHYGWYDPYWGHHHHHHGPGYQPDYHKDVWYGSRHQTGSDRLFAGTSSLRGGIGSRSTVSRNESAGRTASTAVRASSSNRTSVSRTPAGRAGAVSTATTPTRVSSGNRTTVSRTTPSIRDSKAPERVTGTVSRPASDVSRGTSVSAGRASTATGRSQSVTTTQPNYRRPAVVTSDRSSSGSSYIGSGSSASGRSAVSSGSQPGYNRSSTPSNSSSSYNRSGSSATSRSSSSFSSGSSSRSSSGGGFSGGGASRSGGSAGGRR